MPRRPRLLGLVLASVVVVLAVGRQLWAALEVRPAKFAWDKTKLRATFAFKDALDDKAVAKKLHNGLSTTLFMNGYVVPNGGGDPVGYTGHTCKIAYDLWNEVYEVVQNGKKAPPVVNMKGVHRLCTEMVDMEILDRNKFKAKTDGYYLEVRVEVNPVSEETLKRMQQWVTRPAGASATISPGDALFASFVGVFMKKLGNPEKVVDFKTASFPP